MTLSLADLYRLRDGDVQDLPPFRADRRSAAVALIFHQEGTEPALCLARRAPFQGDPWSGHMAFPGGGAHAVDRDFQAVAIRETREEVGLDLSLSKPLAVLAALPARGLPPGRQMTILPLVYSLTGERPALTAGPEIAAAYWVPTAHLWNVGNLTEVTWRGQQHPGITFGRQIVWGLTYRILAQLGRRLGKPLPGDPLAQSGD